MFTYHQEANKKKSEANKKEGQYPISVTKQEIE